MPGLSWRLSWGRLALEDQWDTTFPGLSGWLAGWAEAPLGSFWKGIDSLSSSARQAPLRKRQGAADLVAFGPSRHRAWVVSQRPLECSLGSRGRSLGGLMAPPLRPLGGRFGASWGLFWASWEPLGASWGPLGSLLGGTFGAKMPPKAPKRRPRGAQDAPRGTQDAPRGAQGAPKPPQEAPKTPPGR